MIWLFFYNPNFVPSTMDDFYKSSDIPIIVNHFM